MYTEQIAYVLRHVGYQHAESAAYPPANDSALAPRATEFLSPLYL